MSHSCLMCALIQAMLFLIMNQQFVQKSYLMVNIWMMLVNDLRACLIVV